MNSTKRHTSVNAAAKRLIQCPYDESKGDATKEFIDDVWEVAKNVASEHDETPVDEAWLRSVGFERDYVLRAMRYGHIFVWDGMGSLDVEHDCGVFTVSETMPTRGQVRTLCRLLGVSLTEAAQ